MDVPHPVTHPGLCIGLATGMVGIVIGRTTPRTIRPPAIPFYPVRGNSDIAKLIIGLCGVQKQASKKNLPAQNRAWIKSDGSHLLDRFKVEAFDLAAAAVPLSLIGVREPDVRRGP